MKKGFTLMELLVVIIIIGVLASLGLAQYSKVIEKGRTAEAKMILGQLRTAESLYYGENDEFATVANLSVDAPSDQANPPTGCPGSYGGNHFFEYSCETTNGACTATRCLKNYGKKPGSDKDYVINLTLSGVWGGDPGYY